ncbi:MAG: VCBS repeat-containing protein [Phaeodactylibacter sp.]|nr:VCBS repeat-containing protein [Phaeodactylibacter sp.]MCB9276352.1 VCBS repeat-containing protein [Lewinellaceae bacterium]
MRNAFAAIVGLLSVVSVVAQPYAFFPAEDIPFFSNGHQLPYALAGGLEAPQFVEMGLNSDELPDLIAFDRAGSKAIPFEAYVAAEGIRYRYAPAYEAFFPPLYQFFQAADLNCDGLADLLTMEPLTSAADVALKVYLQQPGGPNTLAFEAHMLRLLNNPDTVIRIHAFDLPTVADINGDGLLDILYIPQSSTQIQYYENISAMMGSCDSLAFELRDDCWGNASYELDGSFLLHNCGPRSVGCAGSAMLATDEDGDGDKDLLFSGIYDTRIRKLINGGNTVEADLISQDESWLQDGEPLMEFPAPYLVKLGQQNTFDLLVATNRLSGVGAGLGNTKIYRFSGSEETGGWELLTDDFLIRDMVDPGFRSSPAVWDANGDGLPDLLVAYNKPHVVYGYVSAIALYLNEGTATQPAFHLAADDCGGLLASALKAIHPTFGDIDGDGQAELVIGLADGKLRTYHATAGDSPEFTLMAPGPFDSFQLNGFAKPQLIDVNDDGLPDLACGTRNGTTTLLINEGTAEAPSFTLSTDTLGGIVPQGYFQENSPFLLPAGDGLFWLYNGQYDGKASLYKGQPGQDFFLMEKNISPVDVGERASICLYDLNGDQLPELIAGNMRGGIEIFTPTPVSGHASPRQAGGTITVFPNPSPGEEVFLSLPLADGPLQLLLYDATGHLALEKRLADGPVPHPLRIGLHGLPGGIYYYSIRTPQYYFNGKLIVNQ